MNVSWTVVAGVAVFVVGQVVVKFFVEPWQEYRALVGRIAHAVILYSTANYGHAPSIGPSLPLVSPVPPEEAIRVYRSLAGKLHQRAYAIPLYGLLAFVRLVPSRAAIQEASANLIGMSNSVGNAGMHDRIVPIRTALRIYDPSPRSERRC